jgi:hypothetical protein
MCYAIARASCFRYPSASFRRQSLEENTMSNAAVEQVAENPQPAPIPNYAATPKMVTFNGDQEQWMDVRFGCHASDANLPAHIVEVRKTDMADQFDLVEIASGSVDNDIWLSLAIVAMSVRSIDGVPQLSAAVSKAVLRKTLKAIGPVGVRAVRRALGELDSSPAEVSQKASAGN